MKKLLYYIDPRILLPSRKTFTEVMIPALAKQTKDTVVADLRSARFVSISFDLWMTRGCQDFFSVIAYWIDGSLQRRTRYLRMIKMDSTSGSQIALHLTDVLDEFKIKETLWHM